MSLIQNTERLQKIMPDSLPLLPTSVIGSYAWPGWLQTALEAARRGEYGPLDVKETQDDAVDLAIREQAEAGVDVITDGEMRRGGLFTPGFFGGQTGPAGHAPPPKTRAHG